VSAPAGSWSLLYAYGRRHESALREAALYVGVVAISVAVLLWQFYPAYLNLNVPFFYAGGDSLFTGFLVKTIINYGWVWHNPAVGAPAGVDLRGFPIADALHIAIIRGMSLFTSDWATLFNLFYLLGFPLSALSALFLMRSFSVSRSASVAASILFAFLPSHFLRGEPHLFLASYYVIPLTTLVILWISCGYPLAGRRRWLAAAICVLTGIAGIYYAYFGAIFLILAGVRGSSRRGDFQPMIAALACAGILSAATIVVLIPNLAFTLQTEAGVVNKAFVRSPLEAETYGLRLTQMLLPVSYHRVSFLAELKRTYYKQELPSGATNESDHASLGSVASLGFLAIVVSLLCRLREDPLWDSLGILTVAAFLIATAGGFSAILIYVIREIRCYNRISVYIALWSLFAAALLWDRAVARLSSPGFRRAAAVLLVVILVAGVLDQCPPASWYASRANTLAEYAGDQEFVDRIEEQLPAGAMIFQLPYVRFPEHSPVNDMLDYDLMRGYLHSRNLRWSYGSIKGSAGDYWERAVAGKSLDESIAYLTTNGFKGIYIDRFAFSADQRTVLEEVLSVSLGPPKVVSGNGRLVFYSLSPAGHSR
jgi:phosphoglycerol transferase